MHIKRVVIRNFRNFKHIDVDLDAGLTCLVGENNSGKTNFLHAIRLALDANLPPYARQLAEEDLHHGLDLKKPQQILIAVQMTNFSADKDEKKVKEHALAQEWIVGDDLAQVCYRFLPNTEVLERYEEEGDGIEELSVDDYEWEVVAGQVTDDDGNTLDLPEIKWTDRFEASVRFNRLSAYRIEYLHPIRNVEEDLRRYSSSPLLRLLESQDIAQEDKQKLIEAIKNANSQVTEQQEIQELASTIENAFEETVGPVFRMAVNLGMAPPTFRGIARSLTLLLSDSGIEEVDPSRNGLGLNNALYMAMLLKYFEIRGEAQDTAGQLLLIEEPEAHLHPQLQRIIFGRLLGKGCQVIASSHSTHITSRAPFANLLVLTREASARTSAARPGSGRALTKDSIADLERYLDATKSVLLYAKRVMLVEGMSEVFMIPALVNAVLDIDLEAAGIAVVPIHGVHFDCYMRLFGPSLIRKKCAVVTDGDLKPSDASTNLDPEEKGDSVDGFPNVDGLKGLENEFVRVFPCKTTFERALADRRNLKLFACVALELGAKGNAKRLVEFYKRSQDIKKAEIKSGRDLVLRTAKRFGKARFAQVACRYIGKAETVPKYISDAVEWLTK